MLSLCNLCVLCVSVVNERLKPQRHREHRGCTEKQFYGMGTPKMRAKPSTEVKPSHSLTFFILLPGTTI